MTTNIYVLKNEDGQIRYVGKTTTSVEKRLHQHIKRAMLKPKVYRDHWIMSMIRNGFCPLVEIVETVSGNGSDAEIKWIANCRKAGFRLTNMTDGGEGTVGTIATDKTRKKMSDSRKGKAHSDHHRKAISDAKKGKKFSESHVENLKKSHSGSKYKGFGRVISAETKAKIAASVAKAHAEGRCAAPKRDSKGVFVTA